MNTPTDEQINAGVYLVCELGPHGEWVGRWDTLPEAETCALNEAYNDRRPLGIYDDHAKLIAIAYEHDLFELAD